MEHAAYDRDVVMKVIRTAVEEPDPAPLEPANRVEAARMKAQLREALDWMENEEPRLAKKGEVEDLEPGARYISQHPVVALVQSSIEKGTIGVAGALPTGGITSGKATSATAMPASAKAAVAKAVSSSAGVLGAIGASLASLFREKAKFPDHKKLNHPLRFDLEEKCTVALVGDWGTGFDGAVEVIKQIAEHHPRHMIHLGDIYMSGSEEEVEQKFIGPLKAHGPSECTFWAMNGNHEMNSGGHAYFGRVLPFCGPKGGQPASYFALGNRHWRLVALDTAYEGYRLHAPQLEWVAPLLIEPGPKNILLTHHQVFSILDGRPMKHNTDIFLGPLAEPGDVFAWFWGHEHNCVIYEPDMKRGGMRARCIGHGGKDQKVPKRKKPKDGVPAMKELWTVPRPGESGKEPLTMNGFALLEFDGPQLNVTYVAADGRKFFPETWHADK